VSRLMNSNAMQIVIYFMTVETNHVEFPILLRSTRPGMGALSSKILKNLIGIPPGTLIVPEGPGTLSRCATKLIIQLFTLI